jgi:hypothetical protein
MQATNRKSDSAVKDDYINAVLIDPFKHDLFEVSLRPDNAEDCHRLLDCSMVEAVRVRIHRLDHVIWVDEAGFLREPFVYPQFRFEAANGFQSMAGYGLITGISASGRMTNAADRALYCPLVWFEQWQERISPDRVIHQLMRLYLST